MTMLDHAQAYAGRGWHVFPIKARGKEPLTNHGMLAATTNSEIIKRWWERWPDANIGLNCAASGLVVIDVDPRNGGDKTWSTYVAKNELTGRAPSNIVASTGGGGWHHIYRAPAEAAFKKTLGPGVDIQYRGYILLAPSRHPSGRHYEWAAETAGSDEEPRELPEWMLQDMTREATQPQEFSGEPVDDETWDLLVDAIEHTSIKERRAEWVAQGMALHSTGHADALELWDERSQLTEKYDREELEREWSTFKDEKKSGVVTYKSIFREAQKAGWVHPGGNTVRSTDDPEDWAKNSPALPEEPPTAETPAETPPGKKPRLRVTYHKDMTTGVTDPQLVQNLIMAKSVNVIYGPSGAGKTFLAQRLALDVALGAPFFDRKTLPSVVAYVAAEAYASAARRFAGAQELLGTAAENLYAIHGYVDLRTEDRVTELIDLIKGHPKPGLVIIDTLAAAWPGIEENSSEGMGTTLGGMNWIRDAFDCAVVVVHHSGKDITNGARGHSSLRAAVDTELQVTSTGDQIKIEVKKFRDGRQGDTFYGQLESIELGTDQWNETARTAMLTPCGSQEAAAAAFETSAGAPKGARQKIMWDGLQEIWSNNDNGPIDAEVAETLALSSFPQGASGKNSAESMTRKAARTTLEGLVAGGWIERDGDQITPAQR